ncbi:DUF4426 domain-containing protein [Gammaproteobacteria bacterium AB-CW1]|uniref:DUF4426 domain-containing protein n=1 Tax=Natronospira elongata TaxID=3110268 RepID=A0AAP6MMF5_9GAMM|nr:DUF4426 domain-containing protein [Gammaproteobacteria bacterium AB-CW1]
MRTLILTLTAVLAMHAWQPATAEVEQSREVNGHIIYFNVLPTSALPEAMARTYGITRSDRRVLLNVAVHRTDEDTPRPVEADIDAQAVNLSAQLRRFRMQEIRESGDEMGEAIYYIGDIRISEGETLNFTVTVAPRDSEISETIEFQRTF